MGLAAGTAVGAHPTHFSDKHFHPSPLVVMPQFDALSRTASQLPNAYLMFVNEFFLSFFLFSFAAVLFLLGFLLVADGITRLVRAQYTKIRLKSVDGKVSKVTVKAADHRAA